MRIFKAGTICLLFLLFLFVRTASAASTDEKDLVKQALFYYQSPGREQLKASELIQRAVLVAGDERIKRTLYLDLGRIFSQSYDREKERPDYPKAVNYYLKAIGVKQGDFSLDSLEDRNEVADLLIKNPKDELAKSLLLEVINVKPDKVVIPRFITGYWWKAIKVPKGSNQARSC
jgi:hypothetical protein